MAKCSPARKQRLRERAQAKAAADKILCDNLRANGASCSTCRHSGTRPLAKGLICELDSDFQGYCPVARDYICPQFSNKI